MKGCLATLLSVGLMLLCARQASAQAAPVLVGHEWIHQVQPKETLNGIARRHGLSPQRIRALNGLKPGQRLKVGQRLHLSNRHIVPSSRGSKLLINIPDLRLYRFEGERLVAHYPVSLGEPQDERQLKDPKRWQTPSGTYKIAEKRANPAWNIPRSIQEEREAEGKQAMTRMPPGPENPLGKYWLGLTRWGYGIHGTIAPSSIGKFATHGCIRMKPGDVAEVFKAVKPGDVVRLAYEPVKVMTDGAVVWLEVTRDPYARFPDLEALAQKRLAQAGALDRVDPARVAEAVRKRWGVGVRVERGAPMPFPPLAPVQAVRAAS
ncbi:putative L,D-transpeptidase YnhG precursor [compost metagenome]